MRDRSKKTCDFFQSFHPVKLQTNFDESNIFFSFILIIFVVVCCLVFCMIVGRMTLHSLLHPLLLLLLTMTNASTAASTTTTKSISSLLLRHQQRTIIFDQKNFNHSLPLKNHSANNASSTNTTFAAAAAAAVVHLLGKDGQQSTGMFTQEQTHFHTISNKWEDALKLVNIFFPLLLLSFLLSLFLFSCCNLLFPPLTLCSYFCSTCLFFVPPHRSIPMSLQQQQQQQQQQHRHRRTTRWRQEI